MNTAPPHFTDQLRDAVAAYCTKYSITPAFAVSEVYDLEADWTTKSWPFATDYGCYAFYRDNGDLLYIGKASLADLGSRLSCHFLSDQTRAIPNPKVKRSSPPRFLQTIRVNEQYEPPSLEEYLIRHLRPSDNRLARQGP